MIISEKQIKLQERFLSKVSELTENDCKEWLGAVRSDGYGIFQIADGGPRYTSSHYAHRVSYELFVSDIPKGLCVLHKCDNRKCVNPDHLFIGTNKDNTADMMKKERGALKRGSKNPCAKLTESNIKDIFDFSGTLSQREIAKKFNVTQGLITNILNHRSWKTVSQSMVSMSGKANQQSEELKEIK